jgi:hypothetical protein
LIMCIRYSTRTMATWLRCCLRGLLAAALACAFLLAAVPAHAQPVEKKAEADGQVAECQATQSEGGCGSAAGATAAAAQPPALPPADAQPAPGAVPASAAPDKPLPVAAPAGVAATTLPQPPAAARGGGLRMGGIVVASIGAAGIVTGVIFSLESQSVANDVTADNARRTYSRSKDNRGRVFSDLQWMGYTLGAALLVDGGFLYYLGYRDAHAPAADSLSFLPVLLPGGTGAVMQGSF